MSAKVHHEYATIALVLVDRSICCAGAFLWFQLFDFVMIHIRHESIDAVISVMCIFYNIYLCTAADM